jgi:predicted MFS family arabinose efflux permease
MADATAPTSLPHPGQGTSAYRFYILGALLTVYTFNFIDRTVVGILQEPIKDEFGLSDLQLGLLGGPAFAILYTLLGIPIARIAEKQNRVTIVAIALAIWSGMTALCGFASSYMLLLLARIGVSVGEAGCTPPAQSVISDYFPAHQRSTAISIYALGVPVGSMLAAVGGGYIATAFGWREAFWMLGVPGLLLALIVKLTIREPVRTAANPAVAPPNFREAFKILQSKPTFWHVAMGGAMASFTGYGVGQYLNSYMMRTHHLTLLQSSQLTGAVLGAAAAVGTFLAGYIADRIVKKHPNALAWLPALGMGLCAPLYLIGYSVPSLWVGVPFLIAGAVVHYFYLGSMYSAVQGIVDPMMRATSTAILLFIVNLLGYGLGPPVIGALSDFLASSQLGHTGLTLADCKTALTSAPACAGAKEFGLRWAIKLGLLGYLWAGAHFLFAWKTLRKDWVG